MSRLVVDAMNVIGSRPTGWWRDRPAAVRKLLDRLQRLAATSGEQVVLVLDAALPGLPEGVHDGVQVVHSSRAGPNAADDRIVALVAADPAPSTLTVVTSDRALQARAAHFGARVCSSGALLRRLDDAERGAERRASPGALDLGES